MKGSFGNNAAKTEALWNRQYLLLSVANFFSWLSYNMIAPVLTGYTQSLGASVAACGIVGGLFAFTSCLSRPISGLMADRINRKWLMSAFTILMTLSLFLYAVVPNIAVIMIFRGIHGIAFGISSTASLVLVSESVPESRMGEGISYYGVMSVASIAIGPGLGISLSETVGYQACMLISAVILAIASVATIIYPYKNQKVEAECNRFTLNHIVEPKLLGLSAMNAVFTLMNGVVSAFLVVFAAERGIEGVSWHFTLNAIVLIFSRVVLAKRMNTWSLKQNLYPAFVCGIVALVMISRANALWILLVAAVIKAFASGMSQPAIQTEGFRMLPPERRGVASSTIYIGGDLGQAIGPMIGGAIAQSVGYRNMYWICALPLVIAFAFFVVCEKRRDLRKNSLGKI